MIDCIDRPDLVGGPSELARIIHAAMAEIDQRKLVDTALQMKRTRVRDAIPKSTRSIFGRHDRRDGDIGYVAAWGLFVHARARPPIRSPAHQEGWITIVPTIEQIRKVAQQSGARDISKLETDIILTFLLQLFHEKKVTNHVAFKGGTMLRKMIFGPRGRYSTDFGFTRRTDITDEGIMELMLDALSQPYHDLTFRFDRDKDWYFTDRRANRAAETPGLNGAPICVSIHA